MQKLMINETFLDTEADSYMTRRETNAVVIHHTGTLEDADVSADEIDCTHKGLGWTGIGYHYVIRKDGTIERGRPHSAIGAHAYGRNSDTIGIALSGNFELTEPTPQQIESTALLTAHLTYRYEIPLDATHILGHRDINATACPGRNLGRMLPTIIGKAIWYQEH
jgi:N-acetyl-anhydromuramyl-L-alanine amidase AmpD